jgi:membrane complex biogenesis BtpA family protein
MRESDRIQKILDVVLTEGNATVDYLADILGVSKVTIRRDLQTLCSNDDYPIKKVRGGVMYAIEKLGFEPSEVIEWAKRDLLSLQNGGVDGVIFSNEFSLPYLTKVPIVTVATMARIIGELIPHIKVPFGVDVLWDPIATIDLAVATGAKFVREVFSGVYASDFGLWNLNYGEIARHRKYVGAQEVKMLFNVVPESAKYLAEREILQIVKTTLFNHRPDALCVSGLTAGSPVDLNTLLSVKEMASQVGVTVFANTGVTVHNVDKMLEVADGAIVGTAFKYEGKFENHVDEKRVREFMEKVHSLRKNISLHETP